MGVVWRAQGCLQNAAESVNMGQRVPFGFGKLKVIADLYEQVQSSGRYRIQTVISV